MTRGQSNPFSQLRHRTNALRLKSRQLPKERAGSLVGRGKALLYTQVDRAEVTARDPVPSMDAEAIPPLVRIQDVEVPEKLWAGPLVHTNVKPGLALDLGAWSRSSDHDQAIVATRRTEYASASCGRSSSGLQRLRLRSGSPDYNTSGTFTRHCLNCGY